MVDRIADRVADAAAWLRARWTGAEPARAYSPQALAEDGQVFASDMYAQLRQTPGNLFFSPLSIRTALGMAYAGARSETAAQMRAALRFPPPGTDLHAAFGDCLRHANAVDTSRPYALTVANALWSQQGMPLAHAFRRQLRRHYGGSLQPVDFRQAEQVAQTVNRWIEDQTRQLIRNLVLPQDIDPDMRLMLANAIHFKGRWALPFAKSHTQTGDFHRHGGGRVQVPLMRQTDRFRFLRAPDFQALELGYEGAELAMLILLPQAVDGLPALEAQLSAPMLRDCVERLRTYRCDVSVPRFRLHGAALNLNASLGALGMPLAFDSARADFAGINGRKPPHQDAFSIGRVLHRAVVDVDEEGTQAAAVTRVDMFFTGMAPPHPPKTFRADHPFVFAIRERLSGQILFLGRLLDPSPVA